MRSLLLFGVGVLVGAVVGIAAHGMATALTDAPTPVRHPRVWTGDVVPGWQKEDATWRV